MKFCIAGMLLFLAVGAVGCAATAPALARPPLNAEFAWGCWVEKFSPDGRVVAFLRLLPEGDTYAGDLSFVLGIKPSPPVHISIARDGSKATASLREARIDLFIDHASSGAVADGSTRLAFSGASKGGSSAITFTGKDAQLHVSVISRDITTSFDGERDGCD